MTQQVNKGVFCGTLEAEIKDFDQRNEHDDLGIKLYKIQLSTFEASVCSLIDFLTPSELNRANRFYFNTDKNRFIICRTVLKFLLAEQIGLAIDTVIIEVDANKKPYLPSHPAVYFNVTHAADYAIIAIAKSTVGIDIEIINKDFDFNEILPTVFNASEIAEVINSSNKHFTFYKLWTRKEAIVKATGRGIDDGISEIVAMDGYHTMHPELIKNIENLQVFSFKLEGNYIGAVACSSKTAYKGKLIFYSVPVGFQEVIHSSKNNF